MKTKIGINLLITGLSFSMFIPVINVHSQVTIGHSTPPASGSILQIKNKENEANNTNADKGLLLPRVQLVDVQKLQPMYSYEDSENTPSEIDKQAHTGLMVYNIPSNNLCPDIQAGIYIWDGKEWNSLMPKPILGTVTGKSGTVYLTRKFGLAGEWMIENLRERDYDTGETGTLSRGYTATATNKLYYYPNSETTIGNLDKDSAYFYLRPDIGLVYSRGAATNGKTTDNIATILTASNTTSTVQGICPKGWKVPSDYDWDQLEKEIANSPQLYSNTPMGKTSWNNAWSASNGFRPGPGNQYGQGVSMKSCEQIFTTIPTNGSSHPDGFNALIIGFIGYPSNNTTINAYAWGTSANFWSSTNVTSNNNLVYRLLNASPVVSGVYRETIEDTQMLSVRCKKANE